MMESIAGYVLRLICGAMCCGLLLSLTGSEGPGGKIRAGLCGLFLAYLAISPLAALEPEDFAYMDPGIAAQADALARSGEAAAKEAMAARISDQCGAYILNKAGEMHLNITAEVALDPETGIPVSVRISGSATPYEREALTGYIIRTLGLERSGIQWLS